MGKGKKAIIFGTSGFADVVCFYLTNESEYDVVAFTASSKSIDGREHMGLPLVVFEDVEKQYAPDEYEMFIAIGYTNMNKTRAKFFMEAKKKGYTLLTHVSPRATCWAEEIGENCFVFEDNTIQPYVKMGDNVVLWSGNHIGHHSNIRSHCFIASHAVISGHCTVNDYTFIGVNATLRDGITIGRENIIGAGAVILKDTNDREVYASQRTPIYSKTSDQIKNI